MTAGRPDRGQGAPLNPPLVLSSTFVSQGVPGDEPMYGRADTPAWHAFEEALAALEACPSPALVLGSGMGAIAAALSLVPPGGRLVLPRRLAVTLHLQGHTVPEAGSLLGWNAKRAENLVYRGLADLRDCLAGKGVRP